MVVELADWEGLVDARHDDFDDLRAVAVVGAAEPTWSGPFRVAASDGRQYFVKSLDTCPAGQQRSLVSEHVIARAGRLIGAPMCDVSLIRIPDELAGYEVRSGVELSAGLAHASMALSRADERGRPHLDARHQDDNRRRHVGVYALYDWCLGADQQWLYDIENDRMLYSHDHGLYFPPAGTGTWTISDLMAHADTEWPLPDPAENLLPAAVEDVAEALRSVPRQSLRAIINSVPAHWPVDDADLEALGYFLEYRAPAVAERVDALVP